MSLLAPIAAYLAAETLGVSGVLATVTAGLIAGRRAARVLSPDGRLMGTGVWADRVLPDRQLRVHADRPAAAARSSGTSPSRGAADLIGSAPP